MTEKVDLADYKSQKAKPLQAELKWAGNLHFEGRTPRGYELDFDAAQEMGCFPTEALLLSLAGCLAIDVVSILQKQRVVVKEFTTSVEGDRHPTPPQYFTDIRITLRLKGEGLDEGKLARAIELSQDKYCSVRHCLRPETTITITPVIED